jgi:hypothetical protein
MIARIFKDQGIEPASIRETLQPRAVISMGDKSPKAKDKAKKQDTADKNQKKAAAVAKASQGSAGAARKGK